MNNLNEKENNNFVKNITDEFTYFQKEDLNLSNNFNSTRDINFFDVSSIFLNNKKKRINNKRHTKYSYDNLKRECKHLVIESVLKFINDKIEEVYEGNIGNGLMIKRLMKLNQAQKINGDVEFNKLFITKTLKEILSESITKQIKLYDQDHNKKIIDIIIAEKKVIFGKIFNLTFIDCLEHFIGNKQIEELNGLTLFTEIKEQFLDKYNKDGEAYFENLKIFLKDYKNKINSARPRKKRKKNN